LHYTEFIYFSARLDLSHLTEVHTRKHEPATRSRADSTANAETKEPTTFSRLVLNEKHKHMIVSLIAQHFRDKKSISGQREQVDIVRGKGKKHLIKEDDDADSSHRQGPDPATAWCPRCGKDIHCRFVTDYHNASTTRKLTRFNKEGVAELFQKPLFQITCGKYPISVHGQSANLHRGSRNHCKRGGNSTGN
jgi:hypothetical protein